MKGDKKETELNADEKRAEKFQLIADAAIRKFNESGGHGQAIAHNIVYTDVPPPKADATGKKRKKKNALMLECIETNRPCTCPVKGCVGFGRLDNDRVRPCFFGTFVYLKSFVCESNHKWLFCPNHNEIMYTPSAPDSVEGITVCGHCESDCLENDNKERAKRQKVEDHKSDSNNKV